MIELPDKRKCFNLPEQVAQNLNNITYLAQVFAEIDSLPAEWRAYKDQFDADKLIFEGWTTTFEGWELTLATYLANMSSAAVSAIAGQDIAPKTVAQTNPNYSATINISSFSNRQTLSLSYGRVEQINQTLHIVLQFRATQTGSTTSESYLTYNDVYLPATLADKIIDIEGQPATTSDAQRIITRFPIIIYNKTTQTNYIGWLAIVNTTTANQIRVLTSFNSYTTVTQNDEIEVYARVALTLL